MHALFYVWWLILWNIFYLEASLESIDKNNQLNIMYADVPFERESNSVKLMLPTFQF